MNDYSPAFLETRRRFLKGAAMSAMAVTLPGEGNADQASLQKRPRPNVVIYIADQFRADFVGANHQNPSTVTPNIDRIAKRGTNFDHAVSNQPLCTPARGCLFSGQYATQVGTWKLGLTYNAGVKTIADAMRGHGYSANYIGKWHLAPFDAKTDQGEKGFVLPQHRGGFNGLWEASNVIELTSGPYAGTIWSSDGTSMEYKDEYRVDYLTDRAVKFLKQEHKQPFLLVVSQLEPHQQNDMRSFVAPKGYAEEFKQAFVPHDLRPFPGDWKDQISGYYGCVKKIDESVGRVMATLEEQSMLENTIFVFVSDHGCHFKTRNGEYKRSVHDSSIRVPLLMQGPGFNDGGVVTEIVSLVDLAPTLLDAAGLSIPREMMGHTAMPLVRKGPSREQWNEEAFIQISSSMTARALRTPRWTYCAIDPDAPPHADRPYGRGYRDYQLYDNYADPYQLTNLAGRFDHKMVLDELRDRLKLRMKDIGEPDVSFGPARFYP